MTAMKALSMKRFASILIMIFGLLASPLAAAAQEPAAPETESQATGDGAVWPHVWPKPTAAAERIEAALETPVSLDCVATPLGDVIEELLGPREIAYRFDAKAIAEAGFSDELKLTHRFQDLPLASALSVVLGDVDMTYTIDHDALLISTPAGASRRAAVKIYEVADLLRPTESADQLAGTLAASTETRLPIYPPPPEAVAALRGEERRITAYQQMLIVRDTTPGHRQFSELLAALGRAYAEQNERIEALDKEQQEQEERERASEQPIPERPEAEAPGENEGPASGANG